MRDDEVAEARRQAQIAALREAAAYASAVESRREADENFARLLARLGGQRER